MRSHRLPLACVAISATIVGSALAAEPLTLQHALDLAVERNPTLAGSAAEIRAREALTAQAGRLPNPELRTDVENIGGTGDREGFEQTETTLRVSQRFELGGKRGERVRVATLEKTIATWNREAKQRAVLGDTTKAFVHALVAQARVALAAQLEEIGRKAVTAVSKHVQAGASPSVEVTRARVALGRNEIEKQRAERELAAARTTLAASWGDDTPTFGALAGDLTALPPPPSLAELDARLDRHPELARAAAEKEEREATWALERAGRIPDVTLGAGARHFSDNDDVALVVELSAPIPVFDRNQDAITAARYRVTKSQADSDAIRLALRSSLLAIHARLTSAHADAIRLRDDVIPIAQRAFEEATTAYHHGLFRYDDVLDTQRALFALRADHLTALESFHLAAAELEELTGGSPSAGESEVKR